MKKIELLKLVDDLKLDKKDFWVLSSGSLVIRELLEEANDLDIAVTKEGLEKLKETFNLKQKENGWYIVSDDIECVEDEFESFKVEDYEGVNLQNLEVYYEYLKTSTREKDKMKYLIVKNQLGK